jgi:uncharacterized membrane protein YeaQ/YmgE (transglycosylase-associated protein family)
MGLFGWIILGLIAGAIAKAILKRDNGGWFATLLLGVIGALVGGWLGSIIFDVQLSGFWSLKTWLLAIAGSVLVLAIYGAVTGRKGARG